MSLANQELHRSGAEFVFLSSDTDWSSIDAGILFDVPKCLRWIAHGFSKLGISDHDILEREFAVYDALYLECKERTSDSRKTIAVPSPFEIASMMR